MVGERPSSFVSWSRTRESRTLSSFNLRGTHRPCLVAEMPPNLADDRRHRVARDVDTAIDVEAIDRLDQSDEPTCTRSSSASPAGVARGERTHEWHELHEHLIASTRPRRGDTR